VARRLLPALLDLVRIRVERPVAPRVQDEDGIRCLRFNDGVVQSTMRIADPDALDLSYTRAMMGFLLFRREPRHVLLVGLGGGSLAKYCYRHLPRARITALEIDPQVIALRERFQVPPDDERFQVVQADACDYLGREDLEADVILLDGYDAIGLPECLCSESFYARCRQVLATSGVLVANLWGGTPDRALFLDRLQAVFGDRVWWTRPRHSSSLIVLALNDDRFHPQWGALRRRASALDRQFHLDLMQVVNDLQRRPDPDG